MTPTHSLGRPPADSRDLLRLTASRKWISDDGKPGVAFSGLSSDGAPYAWASECECGLLLNSCPMRLAMDRTAKRYSAANGRRFR